MNDRNFISSVNLMLPGHLPGDRHDGVVRQLEHPRHLALHNVHGALGHQTAALTQYVIANKYHECHE